MNIELTDLTRRFGRTAAVDGVSLQAGPGVFGLLGPNGAGKTSLLRMMATVLPPSSGRMRLLDRDPGSFGPRREVRRRLGYLPQNLGYYPGFTVAEFVEYFALLKDMPPSQVPGAVARAIEQVGLGTRARGKLRTLSGGMLRRAGIAQAIVNDPQLLLLDEPTARLDPEQRVSFRAMLRDLGQRATVVVSTHLVEDVGAACTEVALMDAGKIVFHGTPAELTARGEGTGAAGDAPLERGYSAALAAARTATASASASDWGRTTAGPTASGPTASGPTASGPTASVPTASVPTASGPTASGPHGRDTALSATAEAPPRTEVTRAATMPLTWARLLRIELRHNAVPWVLPLVAGLSWFDSYRPSTAMPLMWVWRTFWNMGQGHIIIDFGPFIAGVAAWMAARDGRRGTADLVTATARPRWVAQLATWAATAIWAVGAYLVLVGVMFGVYVSQGVQGQPPWWWVAVGAVAVAAFSAAGFLVGVLYPSRFAAPLAAFGGFLACMLSSQTGFTQRTGWALLLPTNSNGNFQGDSGMLYPWLPDLSIARLILLAGITAIALGLVGLRGWDGAQRLRLGAAALTLAGVAAGGSAVGLAETATLGTHGIVIPALHDAANDQPIAYRPVCTHADGMSICVDPAYKADLTAAATALAPVFREFSGLSGAPVRATQVGAAYGPGEGQGGEAMTISGHPLVLHMPLGALGLEGAFGWTGSEVGDEIRLLSIHAFVGAGTGVGTAAQQAVQAALLQVADVPFGDQPTLLSTEGLPGWAQSTGGPGQGSHRATGPIYATARRLAALPAAARHTWLATHLAALRAGQHTLGELP